MRDNGRKHDDEWTTAFLETSREDQHKVEGCTTVGNPRPNLGFLHVLNFRCPTSIPSTITTSTMSAVAGPSKPKTYKKGKKAPVPVVAAVDSDSDSDSASTDSDDLDATPPTPASRPRNNGSKPSSLPCV